MRFAVPLRLISEEEFQEEEHPRDEVGKFAKKDDRTEGALTVQSKDLDPKQKKRIENHFEKNEEAVKKSKYPDMLRELIDKYPSLMKNIANRREGCSYDSKTHTFSDEDSEEQEMICGPSTTEIWLGKYGEQYIPMISNVYHGHVKGNAYDNHRQKKRYEAMGGGNYIGHVFMELDDGTIIDGSYGQIYPPEVKVTPDMRLRIISPDDPDYSDYVKTARDYPFANNGSGDKIELHKGNGFGKDLPRSLSATPFTKKDDDTFIGVRDSTVKNRKELNKLSKDIYKKSYLSLNGGQKKRIDKTFDKIEGWRKEAITGMGKMGSSDINKIEKLSESYGKFRSIEEFKEEEHPRDDDGKFADKDGSNARVERQKSILQQEIDYLKKYIKRESKIYKPFEKVSDEDRAIRWQNNSVGGQIEDLEEELNSTDTVGLPYMPLKPNTHKIETIDNGMYIANSDSEPKYESEREAMKSWSGMKLGLHQLEGFKKGNSTIKVSIDIKEKNDYGIYREVAEKQINLARIMWNSLSDEERDSIHNLTIEKRPSIKYVKNEKGEDVLDSKSFHEASVVGSWAFDTNELTIRIDPDLKPEMIKGTFIHEVGHSIYHELQDKHPDKIKKWKEMVEKIPPTTKYGKYNLSNWKDSEKLFKELEERNWEWKEVVARDSDGNPIRIGKWNEEVKMEKEPIAKEDVEKLRGNAIKNIAFWKDLYFNEIHSEVHMYMMGQQKRGHMKKTGKATKGITKFIEPYRLLHDLPKMEEPLVIGEAEDDSPIMEMEDITESIGEVIIYLNEYFERVLNEDEGEYEFVIELNDDMTIKRYSIRSMWEETATEESFKEEEHPREDDGKFAKKGSSQKIKTVSDWWDSKTYKEIEKLLKYYGDKKNRAIKDSFDWKRTDEWKDPPPIDNERPEWSDKEKEKLPQTYSLPAEKGELDPDEEPNSVWDIQRLHWDAIPKEWQEELERYWKEVAEPTSWYKEREESDTVSSRKFTNKWHSKGSLNFLFGSVLGKSGLSGVGFDEEHKPKNALTYDQVQVLDHGVKNEKQFKEWNMIADKFRNLIDKNETVRKVFNAYKKDVEKEKKILTKKFNTSKSFHRGTGFDELRDYLKNNRVGKPEVHGELYKFISLSMNEQETKNLYNAGVMIEFDGDAVRKKGKLVDYVADPTPYIHAEAGSSLDTGDVEGIDKQYTSFFLDEEEVRIPTNIQFKDMEIKSITLTLDKGMVLDGVVQEFNVPTDWQDERQKAFKKIFNDDEMEMKSLKEKGKVYKPKYTESQREAMWYEENEPKIIAEIKASDNFKKLVPSGNLKTTYGYKKWIEGGKEIAK